MIVIRVPATTAGRHTRARIIDPAATRGSPYPRFRAGVRNHPRPEPRRSSRDQRAKSDVLWMNVFSFEMFTLPKPVVASQPAFAL